MTISKDPHRAEPLYEGRKISEIERYCNMAPIQRLLNDRYGQGKWGKKKTDPEGIALRHKCVLALMIERENNPAIQKAAMVRNVLDKSRDRGKILEAKANTYRLAFPNVAPNDDVLIYQLGEIEIQLDELTEDQQAAVSSKEGDSIDNKAKRGKLRVQLVTEHRRIQSELGIARAQRSDEIDAAQTIAGYGQAARELLEKRSTRIECPACKDKHAINQGFVLFHFAKHVPWKWESTCPSCGAIITITSRGAKAQPPIVADEASASVQI